MSDQSFTTTFVVDRSAQTAFSAVANVREWWSSDIEGPTDRLGAEFTYHYRDVHRCTMRIVEFTPHERVVWHCLDNHFDFIADRTEWVDTKIIFDISPDGDRTRVRFTHEGLVPTYECFDVCSNAWGGYIDGSLRSLILSGAGDRDNDVRNARALAQRSS
jgi:hypothetical protein